MARVIVILALMFLISTLIFAVTRNHSAKSDADARTTVPLSDLPADMKDSVVTSILNGDDAAGASSTQELLSGAVGGAAPSFETAGMDYKGRASFTGTATPGDEVMIARDGKALGNAVADGAGNWSIEFKIPPVHQEFDLDISAKGKTGKIIAGPKRARVSPATSSGGLARITLVAVEAVNASDPMIGLIVGSVSSGPDGHAVFSGKADPGATIRAALNDARAGETIVDATGQWTMDVNNATGKDAATVTLKLISAAGVALDEAHVPFKLAAAKAEADGTKDASGAEITIRRGDSLWRIAKRHYGSGKKWRAIYSANKGKISDPDMIYAGHRLVLPG